MPTYMQTAHARSRTCPVLLQRIDGHGLISICQEPDIFARIFGRGTRNPTWLGLVRRQIAEISHQTHSEALLPGMGEPVSL